jgi:hypothetical protein
VFAVRPVSVWLVVVGAAICAHVPGAPDTSGARSSLYAVAPVTAGQLTVSDVAPTFEKVGAPGAAGRVATEEVA